jgi:hypothetical protein
MEMRDSPPAPHSEGIKLPIVDPTTMQIMISDFGFKDASPSRGRARSGGRAQRRLGRNQAGIRAAAEKSNRAKTVTP